MQPHSHAIFIVIVDYFNTNERYFYGKKSPSNGVIQLINCAQLENKRVETSLRIVAAIRN